MRLAPTPEQVALRTEVREYFAAMMTPEVEDEMARHEMGGPLSKQLAKQMGADGWLGIGWPKEYGGQDRSPVEQRGDEIVTGRRPLRVGQSLGVGVHR